MSAPHLPPQSCSIKTHNHMRAIPLLLAMIGVALLVAVTTSLVAVTWFFPQPVTDGATVAGIRDTGDERVVPDAQQVRFLNERTMTLLSTSEQVGEGVYPADAYLGRAVVLSADGWLVVGAPYQRPETVVAVDPEGERHEVVTAIAHPTLPITFLQIADDTPRVATLYDWSVAPGRLAWTVGPRAGGWYGVTIEPSTQSVSLASAPLLSFFAAPQVMGDVAAGAPLFSDAGDFVGIQSATGAVIPNWRIMPSVSSLFQEQQVVFPSLPVSGRPVIARDTETGVEWVTGFLVTAASGSATSSTVGVGDVIVRVAGAPVLHTDIGRQIAVAGSPVTVTVLRGDREVDVQLTAGE